MSFCVLFVNSQKLHENMTLRVRNGVYILQNFQESAKLML